MAVIHRKVRIQVVDGSCVYDISGCVSRFDITTDVFGCMSANLQIIGEPLNVNRIMDYFELGITDGLAALSAPIDEPDYEDDEFEYEDDKPEKILCIYCGQNNHKDALCCEFCGGRLSNQL